MLQSIKRTLVLAAVLGVPHLAPAFSLLGPLGAAAWQIPDWGYERTGDIGGPMNLGEEYRWSTPTIYYAFDSSFLEYFGQRGVEAVEEALQIMNDLPPVSGMSPDLTEFPTENKRFNGSAEALQIMDLKSMTLRLLLEIMGLANPERWVWALRNRVTITAGGVTTTNYFVIQRNFDPVTFQPTNRVNDAFYGYTIADPIRAQPTDYADAIEVPLDLLQFSFSSVAGGFLLPGQLYTGLTRDDAGGWRYLLRFNNFNVEGLPPATTLVPGFVPGIPGPGGGPGGGGGGFGGIGSPWLTFFGTNAFTNRLGNVLSSPWSAFAGGFTNIPPGGTNLPPGGVTNLTNLVINVGLRPGIEKIMFKRADFDSLLGQTFIPVTNFYTDMVISNSAIIPQFLQRAATFPDLIFTAEDLGFPNNGTFPFTSARGSVRVNNDAINGNTVAAGPGIITSRMSISFSNILPGYFNFQQGSPFDDIEGPNPFNLSPFVWGSFDATPAPPIVYPDPVSLQDLEAIVLGQ